MTDTALEALVRGPFTPAGTLLLHGAGGGPEPNFPFLDALTRHGRVVAPFYPGTGPSPLSTGPLQVDELAERAVAAADAAGMQHFNVIGYSLGATVAVRVAVLYAERVRRLVLTAGIARASESLRLACGVWMALLGGDPMPLGRFLAWASSSEAAWRDRADDADDIARAIAAAAPPGSAQHADLARRVDVRADLPYITAPTLIVVPRHDRLVDPSHSAELASAIPGAHLAEVPGGHDVAGEAAAQWWSLVAGHLGIDGGEG